MPPPEPPGPFALAYVAVSREGTGAPAEINVHDAAADGLARLAAAAHAEGAVICQLLRHRRAP